MLEHQKNLLTGVSYDKRLFRKELIKSLSWLNDNDQKELVKWVKDNFIHSHADIILDVFYTKYDYAS